MKWIIVLEEAADTGLCDNLEVGWWEVGGRFKRKGHMHTGG